LSDFEPIAIIGRACVLPGALTPADLFQLVRRGAVSIAPVPEGRWGIAREDVLEVAPGDTPASPLIASDRGGYVTGFDGAALADGGVPELARLDPSVAWLLYCAKAALAEAGLKRAPASSALIVGNLSYPTEAMTRFVEAFWLARAAAQYAEEFAAQDPRNRFCSGLPVHLVAQALGIEGPAFALDAACASSLYAMKLACDRLHDREIDLALAGGLARADDLFIHLGFTALQAISPSGRSRPFDAAADGLVPAEGAGLALLKRLEDALRDGDRVQGVIRAIGLSNDGRQNGFLAPAKAGQIAAMRCAYEHSGISPHEIAYVECHATGTPRGDAIEIESLAEIWSGEKRRPKIGSLKGNIGHTITASGVASLIKMLGAFEAGILPPSLCAAPIPAALDAGFDVPTAPAIWEGRRSAAISNFGFGGNNAHLIVEEWTGEKPGSRTRLRHEAPIAIVGLGVLAGTASGREAFFRQLMSPTETCSRRISEIELALAGIGFPPKDLQASLAQQTAILAATEEALTAAPPLNPEHTGVFIGMGCDTLVARHGLRLKLAPLLGRQSQDVKIAAWREANDGAAPRLTAAGVIGTMPNIPANRVQAAKDYKGFGFTVSSEELSGIAALEIAARALRARELDAALVGAVDFTCEGAHEAAAARVFSDRRPAGDAVIVFVLMREEDAKRQGARILATIEDGDVASRQTPLSVAIDEREIMARFGHAHAASGLVAVAAALGKASARARIDKAGAWPAPGSGAKETVRVRSFSGRTGALTLCVPTVPVAVPFAVPCIRTYAAANRRRLIERLAAREAGDAGATRLALLADDEPKMERLEARVLDALRADAAPSGAGIFFGEGTLAGEVAFTFTGAAAIYPGAARELLLAFPEIGETIAHRFSGTGALARALYGADTPRFSPMTQLTGCALVCQAHAELTRGLLSVQPSAAIGLSSGETNALLAFGVWRDLDAMLAEIDRSGLYDNELTGECRAARTHWGLAPGEPLDWRCWRIAAPVAQVRTALRDEPRVTLTIIHAQEDCVIAGDAAGCARAIERIGRGRAIELGLDMIVHCPALEPFAQTWSRIHTRECFPAEGVRFYSNADNRAYVPTRESAANAITRQALETIDFPKTIEQAYADGVRTFIEHGPRGILTSAIGRILEGRPHLAVALERREPGGLKGVAAAILQLWAAGVAMTLGAFADRLAALAPKPSDSEARRTLKLAAHPPDLVFPSGVFTQAPTTQPIVQRMAPPDEATAYDLAGHFGDRATMAAHPAPMALPAAAREGAIVRLFSGVAVAHREFLARQKSLHEQFLALQVGVPRARATIALLPRSRGRSAPDLIRGGAGGITPPSPSTVNGGGKQTGTDAPSRTKSVSVAPPAIPRFTREALLIHASGRISEVFGPEFAEQDSFARQVRMPEPPLLLADRAMLIEGEPGAMGKGRVVTETDVKAGAWYLHHGRMTPGAVIEAGQADLLLISWLGADRLNRGERVYRLLGCDLTFYGGLPRPGDTLRYDIHVDGHAKTGDVRLFFFHYDCHIGDRLLLSVRKGQAGFFTDAELMSSGGVLWDAADDPLKEDARLDPPPSLTKKRAFARAEVAAFAVGDPYACFGAGFERAAPHSRAPTIGSGRLGLLEAVPEFDPRGGPWGRGYLRATAHVTPDAWFYKGHFKNDPCMPGTLMADAATQALAFAMAAMGFTIERDGWRFEPVPDETAKFVCRGQVTPDRAHQLEYEVFIEEIINGEYPAVFAALVCRSDGFKVFGCRRFGLRLVPDWPLTTRAELLAGLPPPALVGPSGDVRGDAAALLTCAWGQPSLAFGALYERFDGVARAPRLPGPPYHFMTRVVSVDVAPGVAKQGATVTSEYVVPADAWYFTEANGVMPLCVLIEVLLQPCGWLASYLGFAASRASDVLFRNLDGEEAVLHRAVTPDSGALRVTARLERFAQAAGSTIVFFTVSCEDEDGPIMALKTDFGFFDPAALAAQVGLPVSADMRACLTEPSAHGALDLGAPLHRVRPLDRLQLIDEITGYWPGGGAAGIGRIRGRQSVEPGAWYFRAHFYQDPVQPGSLGLEALSELARALLILTRPHLRGAVFEPIAVGEKLAWRFRGQVTPLSREVVTEVEALEIFDEGSTVILRARANLWVDGLRIYEMPLLAVRARRSG
jgi:acyl transferase domain-containing protein/3-hydroxymyristoyl/3-hydroxydecanoyl-(acyl carrier protein) dehydratase